MLGAGVARTVARTITFNGVTDSQPDWQPR